MCLESIIRFFSRQPPSFPKSKGKITGDDTYNMIQTNFGNIPIYISDAQFDLTTVDEAKKYLDTEQKQPYLAEGHDCDNFSFAAMGYFSQGLYSFAFGIMWSGPHAFNFMIDADKKLWIVEPQSNTFMTIAEAKSKNIYLPLRFALL
jgi:hypothetical protein